jgi:hypothetical protein
MIVVLLAGAILASPMLTSTGAATSHGRKCKRTHGAHRKRSCRPRARIAISPSFHDFGTIGQADSAPTDFAAGWAQLTVSAAPGGAASVPLIVNIF